MRLLASRLGLKTIRATVAAGLAAAALLIGAVGPMAATPALAESPAPTATPAQAAPQRQYERLERLFQREKVVQVNQGNRLERAGDLAARVQKVIANQKTKDKDTSKLETALDSFQKAIAQARGDHATAASLIGTHDGFGPGGEVKNAADARATVQAVGKAERELRQTIRKGTADLLKALREFRQANKPPASAAPANGG